jgi:acyl-coenzyme A thioesterase 13
MSSPSPSPPSSSEHLVLARLFLERITSQYHSENRPQCYDTLALHGLKVMHVSPGRLLASFPVTQIVTNRYNTLHGGCIATLVDTVGTAALITVSDQTGVSISMSCSYLSPAHLGRTLLIDARVVKAGRSIATIHVDLRIMHEDPVSQEVEGAVKGIEGVEGLTLVAQGVHVKYLGVGDPWWKELKTRDTESSNKSLIISKL